MKTPAPRPCAHCGAEFTPRRPNALACSDGCRAAYRKQYAAEYHARWYRANWERRRAQLAAYKKANPDKERLYLALGRERHREERRASWRAWRDANRRHRAVYDLDYRRQRRAIADGKAAPWAQAAGFALVRYTYKGRADYRAARRDRPLSPNEAALAHYERHEGRWVVLTPPLASKEQRDWAERLRRRERPTYRTVKASPTKASPTQARAI